MNHAQNFERYITQSNIGYDLIPFEDGAKGFRFYQQLENGPQLLLGVLFNANDSIVDITVFNIAKITNPLKVEMYLNLLNELNNQYRYTKFAKVDNEIQANYSLPLIENQDMSDIIVELMLLVLRSVEDSFPKIMKLQWA
ncbi:MAG: hypothetical protein C0P75_009365 [Bacilli bacterium]|uniref:Sensory transduction regulator n=1 Tax=Ureibacillus suwonensis TaxID=313007 RepID=A0ABW0R8Y6_9BACL|nr:hypothetical protein [Bacilli bacterium]